MRSIRRHTAKSIIDDEKKGHVTTCDSAICCCKCVYRKSLYGKTKSGERIFYAYCCTSLSKQSGVVLIIKDHESCDNFAAVRNIADLLDGIEDPIIPSVAICNVGNYSCFDYSRTVDDCGLCLATAYPDCPNRTWVRGSGKRDDNKGNKKR